MIDSYVTRCEVAVVVAALEERTEWSVTFCFHRDPAEWLRVVGEFESHGCPDSVHDGNGLVRSSEHNVDMFMLSHELVLP